MFLIITVLTLSSCFGLGGGAARLRTSCHGAESSATWLRNGFGGFWEAGLVSGETLPSSEKRAKRLLDAAIFEQVRERKLVERKVELLDLALLGRYANNNMRMRAVGEKYHMTRIANGLSLQLI